MYVRVCACVNESVCVRRDVMMSTLFVNLDWAFFPVIVCWIVRWVRAVGRAQSSDGSYTADCKKEVMIYTAG